MRKLAFLAPLAVTLAVAATAQAQPVVNVTVGPDLTREIKKLGDRDVDQQISDLQAQVSKALEQAYPGATADLVLTDLKPNRPTFQQVRDTPGLDPIRSVSVGGAAVEGRIVTADGRTLPVNFSYYTPSITDVWGFATWQDAQRAFQRLGDRIEQRRF